MALVVLLRGINIGGRRTLRPTRLAEQLRHLDAVNVGSTGTLVIRKKVSRARLHEEVARRLPFETAIVICEGREIRRLLRRPEMEEPGAATFVSVLERLPRTNPKLPLQLPARGAWLVRLYEREGRFVIGVHRPGAQALSQLGKLKQLFGVPGTRRSWNTLEAIGQALAAPAPNTPGQC